MSRKFLLEIDIAFTNANATSDAFAFAFVKANRCLGNSLTISNRDRIHERDIRHPTQTRIAFVKANRCLLTNRDRIHERDIDIRRVRDSRS